MKNRLTNFYSGNLFANFDQEINGNISKKALLMVEGDWKDSKGRPHVFTEERLHRIANNTNQAINQGIQLPLMLEHKKETMSTVGEVDGEIIVKEITPSDLPNPKATDLIGKIGMFASNVIVKTPDVIKKVQEGTAKTVSIGLDLLSDAIKELSLVGLPAIPHAALFALTWDDDINSDKLEEIHEGYEELAEKLWMYIENIYNADESQLQGRDPSQLLDTTLYGFVERVKGLLKESGFNVNDNEQTNPNSGTTGEYSDNPKYNVADFNNHRRKYTV